MYVTYIHIITIIKDILYTYILYIYIYALDVFSKKFHRYENIKMLFTYYCYERIIRLCII